MQDAPAFLPAAHAAIAAAVIGAIRAAHAVYVKKIHLNAHKNALCNARPQQKKESNAAGRRKKIKSFAGNTGSDLLLLILSFFL